MARALKSLSDIFSFCKRRGFVFPGSEIYGGLAGSYDYGPLGVQMKKNIRDRWWNTFVTSRSDCVGLESPIIMHNRVWESSGHVKNFVDEVVTCKACNTKHRVDHLKGHKCSSCGQKNNFTDPSAFNLLFETNLGPTVSETSRVFLRPETAQGMFIAFHSVHTTMRKQLPFGIGQTGKSFRNEVSPREFLFRTREFEQAELEFFCRPDDAPYWYAYWVAECWRFLTDLGVSDENLRKAESGVGEGAHYSQGTTDIEYHFPFGWGELWGIANRGDFDLKSHMAGANVDLNFKSKDSQGEVSGCVPFVIEPALGIDRLFLVLLCDAYRCDSAGKDPRIFLQLHPDIAPVRHAVLSVRGDNAELEGVVGKILRDLRRIYPQFVTDTDASGSLGRRYRRYDEIGTPFCITVDFDSLDDNSVTIRYRDTMRQIRVPIEDLSRHLSADAFADFENKK